MREVLFVGCGPGDPELVTLRAQRALAEADLVVYSGSLVPPEVLAMCGRAEKVDASGMVREEITEALAAAAGAGRAAVRLHDGDPAIYGAMREQIDALRGRGIGSSVVPGVTSALAAAAALGAQLTLPGVTQTVILARAEKRTRVPGRESIELLSAHGATMALYLSVHLLGEVAERAVAGGYPASTPAAVVYRASRPDQKVVAGTLADIAGRAREAGITRTAVVLIGEALGAGARYEHSRLYDRSFGHGYRRASP